MAELVDAPDLESGGRPWGFESLSPDHIAFKAIEKMAFFFVCYTKNEDEMLSNVKLLGILNLATSAIRNYVIKNVDISNKIIVKTSNISFWCDYQVR